MVWVNELFLLFLLWVNPGDGKRSLWCYPKTKVYQQTMEIKEVFCRPVGKPIGLSLSGNPGRLAKMTLDKKPRLGNEDQAAQEVMKAYPGLFMTETSAKKIAKERNILIPDMEGGLIPSVVNPGRRPGRPGRPGAQHDGDIHCPTYRQLEKAPNNMKSIHGQQKSIVHFEKASVFQYVEKGTCGGSHTQSCSGSCLQERSITYLMVWNDNPDWPMGFEPFEMESYCSCKNVSPISKTEIKKLNI